MTSETSGSIVRWISALRIFKFCRTMTIIQYFVLDHPNSAKSSRSFEGEESSGVKLLNFLLQSLQSY